MSNLSIISKPSLFAFTGNELVYKIKTTNRFSSAGAPAILNISVSDPGPNLNDTVTFGWMDYTLVFTFKDAPDESGLQLPTKNAAWSIALYVDNLIDALKTNYILTKYYNVTEDSGNILFTSKQYDALYEISATVSASNISINNAVSPSGKTERAGYKIMVRPVMAGEILGEERIPVFEENDEQIGKIGISDYLKNIATSFPFPGTTGTVIHPSPDLKKCWIEYAEYYENSVRKILTAESSDYFYTLPGGIDKRKLGELNDNGISVFEYFRDRLDFLTHQPLRKYVLENQQEIFSFIILDFQLSTLNVKIKAYWLNGNTATHTKASIQAGFMQLKDFDLTPFRLELNMWDPTGASAWPYKFEFWLEDQNDEMITTPRTFILADEGRYDHQFIFRNSLGRYDTVRMTGKAERGAEVDREVINHNRSDADLAIRQFQQMHSKAQEQQSLKVNTGYLDKVSLQPEVYRDYLREFQMSREVYEIVNGVLYPSLVASSSLVSQKDGEQLQYIEFEIIRAYTDEHYVRDPKLIPDQFFSPEFNYRFVQ